MSVETPCHPAAGPAPAWDGATRATVADAMVRTPKTCGPTTTVAQARAVLADDHVHAVLVVDAGRLLTVLDRHDLVDLPDHGLAARAGGLVGRTVGPHRPIGDLRGEMAALGHRRLAVVDDDGRLLGLLCLKRHGRGFCSDADVAARAAERRGSV